MTAFYIIVLTLPTLVAIKVHSYFCHDRISIFRQLIFGIIYFVLLNAVAYFIIKGCTGNGLHISDVPNSSVIRILLTNCNLAFLFALIGCLLFEDTVTLNKLKKYIGRFHSDLKKYFRYSVKSAKSDLKSEVANAYLDWLWWLIEPFCMMLIYTLIFGVVFKAAEEYFPIFIFTGLAMWNFFSRGISVSVDIVRTNKGIITKVYLPKFILLLARNFVNGFKMLVCFAIVILMMCIYQVRPTINLLYILPVMAVFFLLTFGIGTILMHFGVYVNDLSYITGILLSMLMYFTGIFYSIGKRIPEPFGEILEELNPAAFCVASVRNALLYNQAPSLKLLFLWGNLSVAMIAMGVYIVYRNENAYVKVI